MGDKPTEVDCALFGMLAQVVWAMPDPSYSGLINGRRLFVILQTRIYAITLNFRRIH